MSEPNFRHCWDCNSVNLHQDSIVPFVLCPRCKSQDTRKIHIDKCPFCGGEGTLELNVLNNRDYWIVGCNTDRCFGSVSSQSEAVPTEQCRNLVSSWNRRAGT